MLRTTGTFLLLVAASAFAGMAPEDQPPDAAAHTTGDTTRLTGGQEGASEGLDATLHLTAWDQRSLPVVQGYFQAGLADEGNCLFVKADGPFRSVTGEVAWSPGLPASDPVHLVAWGPWSHDRPLAQWDLAQVASIAFETDHRELWFTLEVSPDAAAVRESVDLALHFADGRLAATGLYNCHRS